MKQMACRLSNCIQKYEHSDVLPLSYSPLTQTIAVAGKPTRRDQTEGVLSVCWVVHAVVDVVGVVASPQWECVGLATATVYSECQQEHQHLSSTIHGSGDQVVPAHEVSGAVSAQVVLTEDTDGVVDGDGGVDADEQVAEVPGDDAGVQVREDADGGHEAVCQVEGNGHEESDQVPDGNPLVAGTDGEDLGGNRPGDSLRVEVLDIGAGPDVGTLNGNEDSCLVLNNAQHHHVVQECSEETAENLGGEGNLGGKLVLLGELEITEQKEGLREGVVGVGGEVHVG